MIAYASFVRKFHVPAASERRASRISRCCLGPFLLPSVFQGMYYKKQSCCVEFVSNLCNQLLYYSTEKSTKMHNKETFHV